MNNATLTVLVLTAAMASGCAEFSVVTTDASRGTVRRTDATAVPTNMPMIFLQTNPSHTWWVGATSERMLRQAEARGAMRLILITEQYFLEGQKREFAPSRLKAYVDAMIPPDYTGFVMLDWESNSMLLSLNKPKDSAKHQWAVSSLLEAFHYVKSLRPKAQWGFYDVPHMFYDFRKPKGGLQRWHETPFSTRQARMDIATQATELLNVLDYYAPSIYDQWHDEDSPEIDAIGQQTFVGNAIAHCVELAGGEKPVIACTWHRVLSSSWSQAQGYTEDNQTKLFSVEEWLRDQVKPALAAGANGVVWWGHDIKLVSKGQHMTNPLMRDELPYNGDVDHDLALVEAMHAERIEGLLTTVLPKR